MDVWPYEDDTSFHTGDQSGLAILADTRLGPGIIRLFAPEIRHLADSRAN